MTTRASITRNITSAASISKPKVDTSSMPLDANLYHPDYGQMIQQATKDAGQVAQSVEGQTQTPNQLSPTVNSPQKSIFDELKTIQQRDIERKSEKRSYNINLPQVERDADNEPYGFDHTDKMSMLGALGVSGAVGVYELLARGAQLALLAGEHAPSFPFVGIPMVSNKETSEAFAGANKEFTDWFNRNIERNRLYEEAQYSHPVASFVGNMAGNLIAGGPMYKAIGSLFKGAQLTKETLEAIKPLVTTTENAGAKEAIPTLLDGIVNNSAAKAVINSKKSALALKLSKLAAEGATINASQYDPETNGLLKNTAIGAAASLIIPFGGFLTKAAARPLIAASERIANSFGISLPASATAMQIARVLPFTGIGKWAKDKASQLVNVVKGMKENVTGIADEKIKTDLENRITQVSNQLAMPGIDDYERKNLTDNLASLNRQLNQIGTKAGYAQYLFGNAEKSLADTTKEVSDLSGKINSRLANTPNIDLSRTADAAAKISNQIKEVNAAIRRPALLNIVSDLIDRTGAKLNDSRIQDLKSMFKRNLGITDPNIVADFVEDYLNGDLYKKDKSAYKYINAYIDDIKKDLKNQGQFSEGVDASDPLHFLGDKNNLTFEAFSRYRTLIGQKIETATNSIDRGYYRFLYKHSTEDLRGHIAKYGDKETMDMFNRKNYLRSEIVEPLQKIVDDYSNGKDKEADTFIGAFLKPDQPNDTNILLKKMTAGEEQSKLALRAAVMHEAWDRASVGGVGVNPLKFINEVLKLKETNKTFFSNEELNVFKGYQDFINHVSKITPEVLEEGAAEGKTGKSALTRDVFKAWGLKTGAYAAIGLSGFVLGKGALLPLALASYSFGKLVTTDKGRDLMVKIANLKNKTPESMKPFVKDAFKHLGFYSKLSTIIGALKANSSNGEM